MTCRSVGRRFARIPINMLASMCCEVIDKKTLFQQVIAKFHNGHTNAYQICPSILAHLNAGDGRFKRGYTVWRHIKLLADTKHFPLRQLNCSLALWHPITIRILITYACEHIRRSIRVCYALFGVHIWVCRHVPGGRSGVVTLASCPAVWWLSTFAMLVVSSSLCVR